MKLKYYLRGLGIGILVTALIFIASPGEKEVLSDAEIRERAIQLGMLDSSSMTLADMQDVKGEASEVVTQEGEATQPDAEATSQEGEATQPDAEAAPQEGEATQPDAEAAPQEGEATQPDAEAASQEGEATQPDAEAATQESVIIHSDSVTIVIKSGSSSYTVAKNLEAAGLVADAKVFDAYLCNNGYSRRIGTGTYEIAFGTTEEEIAKIISRNR